MLKIENLNKSIRKKHILQSVNLALDNGVYGFLGPNGAGKTTLIRCITGVYKFKVGTIELDGVEYGNKEYADKIGYLPQSFGLFKDMTVYDVMMYMASFKYKKEDAAKEAVLNAVENVNLTDRINDKVKTLSGGMKRRLGIAQALLGDAKVLIFDEPTAGLDPEERIRFKKIISELEKDKIVIISTHIVSDVEDICDKVIVIDNGIILMNGTVEELKNMASTENLKNTSQLEEGYLCVLKGQ